MKEIVSILTGNNDDKVLSIRSVSEVLCEHNGPGESNRLRSISAPHRVLDLPDLFNGVYTGEIFIQLKRRKECVNHH